MPWFPYQKYGKGLRMHESWEVNQKYVLEKIRELHENQKEVMEILITLKEDILEMKTGTRVRLSMLGFVSGALGSSASYLLSWLKSH